MVTSRGAFFLGLSLIICVAMLIYGPQIGKFRYLTVPTSQGLFILDTKTQMMNVCTDKNCRIVPHEAPGVLMPGMQPTYGQMQMAQTNSLGIVENNNMPFGFSCGNGVCVMPMPQQSQPQQIIQMQQQPKPVEPVIVESERPVMPVMREIMAPQPATRQPVVEPERLMEGAPAAESFVARPIVPVVQTPPVVRQPMPAAMQPSVSMQPQQRPIDFQPAARAASPIMGQPNSAEARVLADERNLQATEQALGLGR